MPSPDAPICSDWVSTISREVGTPSPSCALVGHSLGCIAILRYLEQLPPSARLGPVILVAGFGHALPVADFSTFCEKPLDFPAIRAHSMRFVAIHSDNDPYVPLSEGEYLKQKLGAELIVKKGMGHFSSSEGTTKLPVVLETLLEK